MPSEIRKQQLSMKTHSLMDFNNLKIYRQQAPIFIIWHLPSEYKW